MQYRDWFEAPRRSQDKGVKASLNPEYEWSDQVLVKRRSADFSYIIAYREIYKKSGISEEDYLRRTERETEMRRERFELIEVVEALDIYGWRVNVWIRPGSK